MKIFNDTAILVYQAGIANVFRFTPETGKTTRLMQSDFRACENFIRGWRACGGLTQVAWCNEAGNIQERKWKFDDFDSAPFSESFAQDLHKNPLLA